MATNVLKSAGYEVAVASEDEDCVKEADFVLFEAKAGADVADQITKLRQAVKFRDIPIL